jgi:integrase
LKEKERIRFRIRKPRGPKGKWSILLDKLDSKGAQSFDTLKLESIEAVNRKWLSGEYLEDECRKRLTQIRDKYKVQTLAIDEIRLSRENQRIIDKFIETEYSLRQVRPVTLEIASYEYYRVGKILGELSLMTATAQELTLAFNKNKTYSIETIRATVPRLNNLLKFCKRSITIKKPLKPVKEIHYLTEDELESVLRSIDNELFKAYYRVLFYTGMRTGELFGLQDSSINYAKRLINIVSQRTRAGNVDLPKMGKKRVVTFPSHLKEDLKEVLKSPPPPRDYLYKKFRRTCKEVIGKDRSLHDLRRSFAIHSITVWDLSLTQVAMLLGDSVTVVQNNYSGYSFSDEGLSNLSNKMG